MSIIGALSNASKALAAQQAGVQTAARNLANVNTAGYARQRVVLGDRAVSDTGNGSIGSGVEALGRIQIRDSYFDATVVREAGNSASLLAQERALQRGEAALGEQITATNDKTGATSSGLSSTINDFFNSFDNFAASPTDSGSRQVLLQKATLLADKFNSVDQRLGRVQDDLSAQVESDAMAANTVLQQISDLNSQISNIEVSAPGSALELRDQRQQKMEELAKYINFDTQASSSGVGQVNILVKDSTGANVTLLRGGEKPTKLEFDGAGISAGSPLQSLKFTGGSIAGNIDARDGAIQELRDNIQASAQALVAGVNQAYNPGGTSTNFFATPPPSGSLMAIDPSVDAVSLRATAGGTTGGNEIALAVADVARKKFSSGSGDPINGTVSNFLAKTVSGYGDRMSSITSKLTDQQLVQQMAVAQRDSVSGVSIDEETTDLIKYQRAYEASARVVKIFDEMMQTLVNMV